MRQNVIIEAVPEDLVHKLTKEKTGDSMQVGLNIKIKRIGRGYTQEEIADAIGVARSTYTRYESDKRLPDIYKLCALADYFDVSLDDLVGRDWKPKKDHKGRNIAIKPQPKCLEGKRWKLNKGREKDTFGGRCLFTVALKEKIVYNTYIRTEMRIMKGGKYG